MLQLDGYFRLARDIGSQSLPLLGSYEPAMVALSVFIAVLAAFVALSLSSRVAAARNRGARAAWVAAGGVSMGGGIWAMHFIGMLAFELPCSIAYDPWITLLSMVPGVLASAVALVVIAEEGALRWARLGFGAVLMGAGIGTMHYTGMAAMRLDGSIDYSTTRVAMSVAIAVVGLAVNLLSARLLWDDHHHDHHHGHDHDHDHHHDDDHNLRSAYWGMCWPTP